MGRTACREPQCLYKGALYLYLIIIVQDVQLKSGPYFNMSNLFTKI